MFSINKYLDKLDHGLNNLITISYLTKIIKSYIYEKENIKLIDTFSQLENNIIGNDYYVNKIGFEFDINDNCVYSEDVENVINSSSKHEYIYMNVDRGIRCWKTFTNLLKDKIVKVLIIRQNYSYSGNNDDEEQYKYFLNFISTINPIIFIFFDSQTEYFTRMLKVKDIRKIQPEFTYYIINIDNYRDQRNLEYIKNNRILKHNIEI